MNRQTQPAPRQQNAAPEPRSSRLDHLFPQGVTGLWCAMLTHYQADGSDRIDWPRMNAHLNFMRQHVKGFLIAAQPCDEDRMLLFDWAMNTLKPKREFFMAAVDATSQRTLTQNAGPLVKRLGDASKDQPSSFTGLWADASSCTSAPQLQELLAMDVPVGLGVSGNDADAGLIRSIATLAQHNENLLYAADATADDQLARCSELPTGVFRLRSTEGNYTKNLGSLGGPYHGLLLASANLFPQQLQQLVLAPALGKWDQSHAISKQLTAFFNEAISLEKTLEKQSHSDAPVATLSQRLIKAIDHHMAHGPSANDAPPPLLDPQTIIPTPFLNDVGQLLAQHNLLPESGYLA